MRSPSDQRALRIATRARAIGDPTRVRILHLLARGELPVGRVALALAIEPSTVSKHLQVLFNAGLVRRRRDASTILYSLLTTELLDVFSFLGRATVARVVEVEPRMKAARPAKSIPTRRARPLA